MALYETPSMPISAHYCVEHKRGTKHVICAKKSTLYVGVMLKRKIDEIIVGKRIPCSCARYEERIHVGRGILSRFFNFQRKVEDCNEKR